MDITPRPIGTIRNTNRQLLAGGGAIAFSMSLLGGYLAFGEPIMSMVAARQWQATTCEITSSSVVRKLAKRVSSLGRGPGAGYSAAVSYRYFVDGHRYYGDRARFTSISNHDPSDAQEIVKRYRPGTKTDCWYDPAKVTDSVIERGLNADLAYAFIPLVFFLAGLGALLYAAVGDWKTGYGGTGGVTPATSARTATQLAPASSRRSTVLILAAFAFVANGAVVAMWVQFVHGWRRDHEFGALGIVTMLFTVVGILLLVALISQVLTLAGPRATLTIGAPTAVLGEEFTISWALRGRRVTESRFTIDLDGREIANHTGQNNYSEENLFATFLVAEKRATDRATSGSTTFTIPADSMHSLDTPTAQIAWIFRVRAEVPNWPDTEDEFSLIVSPCP
jgi:hypothetical protein